MSRAGLAPRFRKVVVDGRLNLGTRHDLIQAPREASRSERAGSVLHLAGATAAADAIRAEDRSLGQILDYSLSAKPVGEDIEISDDGMVTSYGIFGSPGSGKTVLLLRLLEQLLAHSPDDPSRRYGCLILDPKAALVEAVEALAEEADRRNDLVVLNNAYMRAETQHVNVIDCTMDSRELGGLLVLAARATGIAPSDQFWLLEWTNVFSAALGILRAHAWLRPGLRGPSATTLKDLVSAIAEEVSAPARPDRTVRAIQARALEVRCRIENIPERLRADVMGDIRMIERFFGQHYVGTVEAFIDNTYGMFAREHLRCYSAPRRAPGHKPLYEDIIENGRIVLVSISPSERALAKLLCTLVKSLFQRTVLGRGELAAKRVLTNVDRPLLIACDEYSEIASEVPGESMGDGQFFALSRQYGCMALLATQSVNVLESSSLRDTWRSVFSNFGAKIYMRLSDSETAETAAKLAGESDWTMISRSQSQQQGGPVAGRSYEVRERRNLPTSVLTQVLRRGEAVVIGSLDGGLTQPEMAFLRVPRPPES